MRLNYVDGLRGIAILLVIFFHAYSRWPTLVPYGDKYAMFPIFKLGWVGVQLFFLISGFVIFLTLDKTESFKSYIYKRWLRLFPAMLIASILIYFTAPMFSERPTGQPQLLDVLPGITFIEPYLWSRILGLELVGLEGAFWSLYVEFKFYIIAGIIYFFCGRKYLAPSLFLIFVCSILISIVHSTSDILIMKNAYKVSRLLSLEHFGWFAAGASFYLHHQSKKGSWFIFALGISFLASIYIGKDSVHTKIAALMVFGLFAISLKSILIQNLLQNRFLLFLGFISYPLYLIHENSMISMIIQMPTNISWLPSFFYPFIPISILSLISYIVAKKCEVIVRKKIEGIFLSLSKLK